MFLSLYIGINIRISIILGIIEALILLGFVFYRFSWKFALICLFGTSLGIVISFIRPSFNKECYQSVVVETKDNYFIASSTFEKLYISNKSNHYEIGDILLIYGKKQNLSFSTIESGFDFKEYLNNKGVYSELIVDKIEEKFLTPIRIKSVKDNFLSHFNDDTKAVVSSILFGNSMDGETSDLFRELHLIRLISNSGVFLNMIFSGIVFLLTYLIKDKYAKAIAIVLLMGYGLFTFPRFVVIKFIFLQILRWINKNLLKDKFSYLEVISFSAIVFLLFDYHLAYQDSFLLAYFIPLLTLFFNGSFKHIKKFKKKLLLSLVIMISFVPFTLDYYHEISLLSFPFQMLFVPFTLMYGLLSLFTFIGIPMYEGINGFTLFYNKVLKTLSPLFIKIYGPPLSSVGIIIFEVIFIAILYFLSIKFVDIYKPLLIGSVGIGLLYFLPLNSYIKPSVNFINVGQGDSCLINYKNTTILIDTGGSKYKDYAVDCLIPYFKKEKVYDIDLLITTHDDIDHSGAVDSLFDNFKIRHYVTEFTAFPIKINDILIDNLNIYPEIWEEDNDKSLVLYFKIQNYSYLITGDAPIAVEKEIVKHNKNLTCDVLKVGHHGSKTSTCEDLIKTFKPKEAVISCGKDNKYGHPHQEVLNRLRKYNIKIRRTDLEGTISYKTYFWIW